MTPSRLPSQCWLRRVAGGPFGSGVPRRAILLGTAVGYASVAATYVWGDVVFNFLINSYGAVALFVYLIIAISQVVLRRRIERSAPSTLKLKMWLFPWLSYATIALMATVILAMAFLPDTRSQFLMSGVTLAVILVSFEVVRRRPSPAAEPATPVAVTAPQGY